VVPNYGLAHGLYKKFKLWHNFYRFVHGVAVIARPRNCIWQMLKNDQKTFNNSAVYQYFRYYPTKLLLLLLNYHCDYLSKYRYVGYNNNVIWLENVKIDKNKIALTRFGDYRDDGVKSSPFTPPPKKKTFSMVRIRLLLCMGVNWKTPFMVNDSYIQVA